MGADWQLWKQMLGPSGGANLAYTPQLTSIHFRADWRRGPSWGPPPLDAWLRAAATGWWPEPLRMPVSPGAVAQQEVWESLAADPVAWSTSMRRATSEAFEYLAWEAAATTVRLEAGLHDAIVKLVQSGEASAARALADEAHRIAPANNRIRTARGLALLSQGQADEALDVLAEATEADPSYAPAWGHLSRAFTASGRTAEAIAAAGTALELRPDSAGLHRHMATLLLEVDDLAGARSELDEALRMEPLNDATMAVRSRLDALQAKETLRPNLQSDPLGPVARRQGGDPTANERPAASPPKGPWHDAHPR